MRSSGLTTLTEMSANVAQKAALLESESVQTFLRAGTAGSSAELRSGDEETHSDVEADFS